MGETTASLAPGSVACCADLYESPLVRYLLGDSWHPGGLALTRTLAKAMHLGREDRLLDVACGRGTSVIMLAQVYKCHAVGIDRSAAALDQARREARRYRLEHLVAFQEAEATAVPFPEASFSTALCECATNLFSERAAGLREIARVLQPSGRLGLSDVTFTLDRLPEALNVPLARALCIPLGIGPDHFAAALEAAGLAVQARTDCSATLVQLLDRAESLLGAGHLAALVGQVEQQQLHQIEAALKCARALVQQGDLGYWAFMARKPV